MKPYALRQITDFGKYWISGAKYSTFIMAQKHAKKFEKSHPNRDVEIWNYLENIQLCKTCGSKTCQEYMGGC